MSVVLAGLVAGAAHVVTGPDHLAAVAPLIAEQPGQGWKLGLRWGFGHGLGVVLLGLGGVLFRDQLDVDALSAHSEHMVGWLLLGIGVWALWRSRGMVVHRHGEDDHEHVHVHAPSPNALGKGTAVFGIGMLHGAAGTGHLLGVLPSLALDGTASLVYLGTYFVSAIGAMTIFGWLMSRFVVDAKRIDIWIRALALSSIAVGILWLMN